MVLEPGINILWISQDEDNANAIRNKFRVVWKSAAKSPGSGFSLDDILTDNPGQFSLKNGSVLNVRFAGDTKRRASNVSRGDTIHFCVFTEVAYWPHAQAVFESMSPALEHARPSIVWDTTPNGTSGDGEFFYKRVMSCIEGRLPGNVHFWSWWEDPRYSRPCGGWEELGALDDQEQWLKDNKQLKPGQIAWRRAKIIDLSDDEAAFKEIYPESFTEAWRSKGKSIFDQRVVRKYAMRLSDKDFQARAYGAASQDLMPTQLIGLGQTAKILASRHLKESAGQGYFRVWRLRDPSKRYFIGIDTSQGLPKSDWMCLVVIDMECNICAILRCKVRSVLFAAACQRIMEYYCADSGIENQSTGPEIHRYLRESMTDGEIARYGCDPCIKRMVKCQLVNNTRTSRPILVTHLQQCIDGELTKIPDAETLREVLNFERKDDGKIEHAEGENDDILLALAIALRIRELKCLKERDNEPSQFYDDMGSPSGDRGYYGAQATWREAPQRLLSRIGRTTPRRGLGGDPGPTDDSSKASPSKWLDS